MSKKDTKKYYFYKEYQKDIEDHRRKLIKRVKGGRDSLVVLDDLKHESITHEGILRRSNEKAYTIEELSAVLDEPKNIIKKALEQLKEYGFINVYEDGTIEIIDFKSRIGCETGKAIRMREYRDQSEEEENQEDEKEDSEGCPNEPKVSPKRAQSEPLMSPESRDKSLELRVKSIEYRVKNLLVVIKDIKDIYYEAGYRNKDLDPIETTMIKAAKETKKIPDKKNTQKIFDELLREDIADKQAYAITCFKNL